MKRLVPAVALVLLAISLHAGEALDRKSWGGSAEAHFMTSEERREWLQVRSDEEARRFVDAFRARHTPDFLEEVARRAAVVDERLSVGETKASHTLRGRLIMLLGAPAEIRMQHIPKPYRGSVGAAVVSGRTGAVVKTRPAGKGMGVEGWLQYTFHFAPNAAYGIGPEGWTVVIEAEVISGKDALRDPSTKKKFEAILDAAAQMSLRAN